VKLLCSFAVVLAAAACGDPGPPGIDDGFYSASIDEIPFDHEVGVTECPQDLGDVEVENLSDEDLFLTISVDDAAAGDLIDFGEADDLSPTALDDLEVIIPPNETAVFVPWFNCGDDADFEVDITLTPDDPDISSIKIPIVARFQ
jgi:hypothetical protein